MNELNYKIEFFSEWHCGSGLSAGANLDALVVKDADNMPFIPGKTLKGLIKEAFEDYVSFAGLNIDPSIAFGRDATKDNSSTKGVLFFSNATLSELEHNAVVDNRWQEYMYNKRVRTAIDENGIAKDHSLRSTETVVPCTLYANIMNVSDEICDALAKSLGMIKRMGVNRNRGLGRCRFSVINTKKGGKQ